MPAPNGNGRRAVITGVGVVAPGAIGTKAFWKLLAEGRTATRTITRFDASRHHSRVAGECDFDPVSEGLAAQQARRLDRAGQFAVVAGREAVAGAGLELNRLDHRRVGVVLGCAVGAAVGSSVGSPIGTVAGIGSTVGTSSGPGTGVGRRREVVVGALGEPESAPYQASSTVAELAWSIGAEGPARVVSTGCTSGIDSVGQAAELIVDGRADVVLTGGTEAPLAPITMVCFDIIRASSTRNDDPEHACRPFDRSHDGLVLAEGSAILVVEEYEHARRRGAHIYAEVAGFASRHDTYHMSCLQRAGDELSEAINAALRRARVDPSDVDYVNAHGSGIAHDDRYETQAFKRSLGWHAYRTPVSGLKSMIGHSLAATGSLGIAGCLLAFEEGVIAPTANLHEPDPLCDLDYTPLVARERRVAAALTVGLGFSGVHSAMVLRRGR